MKVGNRDSIEADLVRTVDIVLSEDAQGEPLDVLSLRVGLLPINFGDEITSNRLPHPYPPRRPLRDRNGPVRDGSGRPLMHDDDRDPAYLRAVARHQRRAGIATIVAALKVDPDVSFSTPEPDDGAGSDAWEAYYDAIYEEFREFGFSQRDFIKMMQTAGALNSVPEAEIEKAAATF